MCNIPWYSSKDKMSNDLLLYCFSLFFIRFVKKIFDDRIQYMIPKQRKMQLNTQKYQQTMRLVVSVGNHYRMLKFDISSAKRLIIKCNLSNNGWTRPKTDAKAVHWREKLQAACNKSVEITIAECGCSKAALWMINSFNVICTKVLAKCTASPSILNIEQ